MASLDPNQNAPAGGGGSFVTTHWSLVLAAADGASPHAAQALERLCSAYWRPVYWYARRLGKTAEDAQDLTQGFFQRVLARNFFGQADQERGKFRSFLLGCFNHFLADESDRVRAQKRGGHCMFLSIDEFQAEEQSATLPADTTSPDKIFERQWALASMKQAFDRLRREYHDKSQGDLFDHLQSFLTGSSGQETGAAVAAHLRMSENTFKSHLHRLRKRYRDFLREVIADTVVSPQQVEEELQALSAAFRDG